MKVEHKVSQHRKLNTQLLIFSTHHFLLTLLSKLHPITCSLPPSFPISAKKTSIVQAINPGILLVSCIFLIPHIFKSFKRYSTADNISSSMQQLSNCGPSIPRSPQDKYGGSTTRPLKRQSKRVSPSLEGKIFHNTQILFVFFTESILAVMV